MKNLLLVVAALGVLAGCDFPSDKQPAAKTDNPPLVLAPSASAGASAPAQQSAAQEPSSLHVVPLPDFTPLMKINGPAVVNVIGTNKAKGGRQRAQPDEDPMLEFFRRFMPPGPNSRSRSSSIHPPARWSRRWSPAPLRRKPA